MSTTILYLSFPGAQPASLGIEEELGQVRGRLSVASFGAEWDLVTEQEPLFDDLPGLFARQPHQVLHISSHGNEDGRLDLRAGEKYFSYAPAQVLPVLLASPARLIFLNACFSATLAGALQEAGRVVIGTSRRVPSDVAGRFASVLYGLLAEGQALKDAFAAAQHVVVATDPSLFSLYQLRGPEGAGDLHFPPSSRALQPNVAYTTESEKAMNQVVILLDAYGGSVDHYLARLPDRRKARKVLYLSQFMQDYGLAPLDHHSAPRSWESLAEATEALVKAAIHAFPSEPKSYYIAGNAPHATFAHLGFGLSHWGDRQVLFHQNPDQSWLDIDLGLSPTGRYFFEETTGLERDSVADGLVGLYLGAMGGGLPLGTNGFFRGQHLHRAGMVALTHKATGPDGRPSPMNSFDAVNSAVHLKRVSMELVRRYPNQTGLVLFVNAPAFVAFLMGRALNPRQVERLHLTWYDKRLVSADGGGYVPAYGLPLPENRAPVLPTDDSAKLRRRGVYDHLMEGIEALRETITPEDLAPPKGFSAGGLRVAEQLHTQLQSLRPGREPSEGVFELDVPRRSLKLGHLLLHTIGDFSTEELHRFGRLLVLHELSHFPQQLRGTNYQGIGRAEVVLEDVDYWADAMAQLAATRWELREGGAQARRDVKGILSKTCGRICWGFRPLTGWSRGHA